MGPRESVLVGSVWETVEHVYELGTVIPERGELVQERRVMTEAGVDSRT